MEINKENEYKKATRRAEVYADSSAEWVLPDYNGDVRKLLLCDAKLHPTGKFFSDGEAELTGVITYNVIYSDPDGRLDSTSFTSEYEYKVKCSKEAYVDCIADTRIANVSVRLIGPRKISARASVAGCVTVIEEASVTVDADLSASGFVPELATERLSVRNTVASESVEREFSETIASLDGTIADEVKVLYSGADFEFSGSSFADGDLSVSGELTVFVIVTVGDNGTSVYEKTIPIDATVPFDEASADMTFIPSVSVVSLKESITPTENGSDILLSATVEFSAIAEGNSDLEAVCDAYTKECVSESTYDDFAYSRFVALATLDESVEGSVARSELDSDGVREILVASARAKIDSCELTSGTARIFGEIKFNMIASDVDETGKLTYFPVKFSTEFSKNVNLDCQINDKMHIEPKIYLSDVRGYLDAENVFGSAKVHVFAPIISSESERVLATFAVREDLPFEKRGSRISVYYPSEGESLFSVAKKFHTTSLKVALDNSLSEAASAGEKSALDAKKLMIF